MFIDRIVFVLFDFLPFHVFDNFILSYFYGKINVDFTLRTVLSVTYLQSFTVFTRFNLLGNGTFYRA